MRRMNFRLKILAACLVFHAGCAGVGSVDGIERVQGQSSVIADIEEKKQRTDRLVKAAAVVTTSDKSSGSFPDAKPVSLRPLGSSTGNVKVSSASFNEDELELSVDFSDITIGEFLSTVVSDLLELDLYVEEGSLDLSAPSGLTLASNKVTKRRLWELVTEIGDRNGVVVSLINDTVLVVPKIDGKLSSLRIGVGRGKADIPLTSADVLQIIPVRYSFDAQIDRVLSELAGVSVSRSVQRNAYLVRGPAPSIAKAQDVIAALDAPAIRGQQLGYKSIRYVSPAAAIAEVRKLLSSEGIFSDEVLRPVGEGQATASLLFVPMVRDSSVVIFSSSPELIERANYWLEFVDKPDKAGAAQYFLFKPQFARAEDIIETFNNLWADTGVSSDSVPMVEGGIVSTGQAPTPVAKGDGFAMVLDGNTNGILIRTTAQVYAQMLDVFELLDTAPAQVLIEITIAEVSLQGEFRMGFEWALSNNGIDLSTLGAFGADSFSGLSVSFQKDKDLLGRILETNSLVRIISSPTLLVREGETASVNIGTRVSVVGQTTFDPLVGGQRQTTAAEYLETGVQVSITPTISGSDIANLDIDQTISNTVSGSSGAAGNPDIFERALKTSVLSRSGDAILLAGLISENNSEASRGLPVLSRIPLLGSLVGNQQRGSNRTELVMLVSPTVFKDSRGWTTALEKLKQKLSPDLLDQVQSGRIAP